MINEQQKERQETIYHYVFHAACSAGNTQQTKADIF